MVFLTAFAVRGGGKASFLFEDLIQVLLTAKPRSLRHLGNADVGIPQQLFGVFYTAVEQILMRSHAKRLRKNVVKVNLAQMNALRNVA